MKTTALYLICSSTAALSFSPPNRLSGPREIGSHSVGARSALFLSAETEEVEETVVAPPGDTLEMPLTYGEMILQATQCISDAYDLGKTRQIVRILLPRRTDQGQLGERVEMDAEIADRTKSNEMKLVPTDESWQGGIMQLYRAACPTTKDMLRQLSSTYRDTGVPPRIVEDRSIDESGVDGVGLCYTQLGSGNDGGDDAEITVGEDSGGFGGFFGSEATLPTLAENDNCIFVQPSQEVADSIEKLSTQSTSSSLIALLNPQWRNVDDALDSASKTEGVFGSIASFLGGKGSVLKRLDELSYVPTYTLEGYVCKGGNVRLIKRFDSDWVVFAEKDKEAGDYTSSYVKLGSMAERPSYQDVETMLNEKGIGYKYARDLGMAPKL